MTLRSVVAVVDDDPRVLESIENLLESAGHDARAFAAGADLLRSPCLSDVHCLISDIAMPDMDGFELQRRIGRVCRGLPVIFLSGHELNALQLAQACSAQGFLRKPFDGIELLAIVARALAAEGGR